MKRWIITAFSAPVKFLLAMPLILFFILLVGGLKRSQEGMWHNTAAELWKGQKWQELSALGKNLYSTGQGDAEVLYLGMIANAQLPGAPDVAEFAARLLEQKAVSWEMDRTTAQLFQPTTLRQRIVLYRATLTYILLAALIPLLVYSLRGSHRMFPWISALAVFGCIVLLL